jgi:hypothetical protein
MDDRYYFSDWGSCTCRDPEDEPDQDCPLLEQHHEEIED